MSDDKDFEVENLVKYIKDFNPDAKDGDDDGFVQDGTNWERPEELPEETVVEEKSKKAKKPKLDDDSVALFTNGTIYQNKWGEITKGYNIVSKEAAEYWLSHTSRVRLATPEEIAKHYGIK